MSSAEDVSHHLLVGLNGIGFRRGDESRTDIGEIGTEDARRADGAAVGDRTRQRDRSIEPLPCLRHERQGRDLAGMAAGAGGHQDQAVGALLDRLVRELLVDDVVKHDAAPAMRGLIEFFAGAERGDDHRHLVLLAERQILIEPVVGFMHDLVHRERRRQPLGMRLVMRGQLFLDPDQPLVEQSRRARVQRRERSDDPRLALRDHEIGHRNDEQRRTDHRNRQTALEQSRHGHSKNPSGYS